MSQPTKANKIVTATTAKHVRINTSGLIAYDATPDLLCTRTPALPHGIPCVGLCPRHNPAAWAEHMAKHTPESLPFTTKRDGAGR